MQWLVGHEPHGLAFDAPESDDHVGGAVFLDLQVFAVVGDALDYVADVVGDGGGVRDHLIKAQVVCGEVVGDGSLFAFELRERGVGAVVGGKEAHQLLDPFEGFLVGFCGEVGVAGGFHMDGGATQVFLANVLAGHGLDNVRAGHKHLGGFIHHDHKVRQCRGVSVAARAGAHNHGDLWNHAGGVDVVVEGLRNKVEGDGTVLDAGAGTFVQADQRAAGLYGQFHDLDHFFAINLA